MDILCNSVQRKRHDILFLQRFCPFEMFLGRCISKYSSVGGGGGGGGSGEGEGGFNACSLGLFSALVDLCQFFYLDAKETRDFAKRRDKLSFLGFLTLS